MKKVLVLFKYIERGILNLFFFLKYYFCTLNNKSKIYVLMEPTYDNIGDQGIAYAQRKYLNNNFPKHQIFYFSDDDYIFYRRSLEKLISQKDTIFLQGGGNFGDEYMHHENTRRDILQRFKNNPIILFPQTIHFKDTEFGRSELQKSINIYSNCKHLTLIAREQVSYQLMKRYFVKNNVLFIPDIVLYLNEVEESNRVGVVTCFRNDDEVVLKDSDKNKIYTVLEQRFEKITATDMRWGKVIQENERDKIVKQKFDQFRRAKLVVTDRLHGMIFCAITGTPCIVFSNYNHKVKGTYEWIKELDYIKYVDNINQFMAILDELELDKSYQYSNKSLNNYYQLIKNI